MLSSCSRILSQKNLNFASLSASFLSSKQLSFNSKQTLLPSLHNSPVSLLSQPIKAGISRPLLGSVRFNHSMASQSSPQSVHDFTVKVEVNGNNAAPIYKFLKSSKGGLFGDNIKWNFSKFLVDKDGKVVDRYAPTTSPLSIEKDVKKLLGIA